MSYCTDRSVVNDDNHQAVAVTVPCRSWTCERCLPQRRKQLIRNAHDGEPDTFLTLTIRNDGTLSADDAAKKLSLAWRHLRLRALREARRDRFKVNKPSAPKNYWSAPVHAHIIRNKVKLRGRSLPFIAVFEAHPSSGFPHLHILLRSKWIDHEWLSANMADLIDSPVVGIERIKNRRKQAAYVAAYCGKQTERFGSTKRYWQSKDYRLVKHDRSPDRPVLRGGWSVTRRPLDELAHCYEQWGWSVAWDGQERFHAQRAPRGTGP